MPPLPQVLRVSRLVSPRSDQALTPLGSNLEREKALGAGVAFPQWRGWAEGGNPRGIF